MLKLIKKLKIMVMNPISKKSQQPSIKKFFKSTKSKPKNSSSNYFLGLVSYFECNLNSTSWRPFIWLWANWHRCSCVLIFLYGFKQRFLPWGKFTPEGKFPGFRG